MQSLIGILCLAALSTPAAAQPSHAYELFPHDTVFRAPVADPAAPRLFMSRLEVRRQAGDFGAAFLGVGHEFGLLRRSGADARNGWQLSVFGSADSLFNLDLPGDALVNTDYRFGFPLTWRDGPLSVRARLYHQSSHFGDELILGGNAPPRIELSIEVLDFMAAWERSNWRVYGGAGHVLRTSTDRYEGATVQAGFDYLGPPAVLTMRPVAGVDVKWLQAADWRSGVSAKAGIRAGRHSLEARGVTLLLEVYDGFAPFGQFFVEDLRYRGVTLQFDL